MGNVVQLINNLFRSQTVVRFYFQGKFFSQCNWHSREKTICCLTNKVGGWHGTRRKRAPSDVTLLFIIFSIQLSSHTIGTFISLFRVRDWTVMHLEIYP